LAFYTADLLIIALTLIDPVRGAWAAITCGGRERIGSRFPDIKNAIADRRLFGDPISRHSRRLVSLRSDRSQRKGARQAAKGPFQVMASCLCLPFFCLA